MKKTLLTGALTLISFNSLADTSIPDVKSQMKVTANVAAGCDISAENINFGVLSMPLKDVSATANIDLVCSKGASLILDIIYGGNGTVSNSSITYTTQVQAKSYETVKIYKDGVPITSPTNYHDIECDYGRTGVYFATTDVVNFVYEQTNIMGLYGWNDSEVFLPICNGSSGVINYSVLDKVIGRTANTGVLKGVSSGETIIYSLENPANNQSLWASGTNAYSFVATGVNQLIPMKANIRSAENVTHRMTPDIYSSTLTVQLTY